MKPGNQRARAPVPTPTGAIRKDERLRNRLFSHGKGIFY